MIKETLVIIFDIPASPVVSTLDFLSYRDFLVFLRTGIENDKGIFCIGIHLPFLQISRF